MPEETNLTHVATTLQFCVEQLELCKQPVRDAEEKHAYACLMLAWSYAGKALNILAQVGIEPAPAHVEAEGSPV